MEGKDLKKFRADMFSRAKRVAEQGRKSEKSIAKSKALEMKKELKRNPSMAGYALK